MVAMAHLRGLSSMPIILRYTASLDALDEMLHRVGHYQQVVDVGLDETLLGPSRRAQAVPLRPEQGLQEEREQRGALRVALPDAAQHVDGLR